MQFDREKLIQLILMVIVAVEKLIKFTKRALSPLEMLDEKLYAMYLWMQMRSRSNRRKQSVRRGPSSIAEIAILAIGVASFLWRRRDVQLFIVLLIIAIGTYEQIDFPTSLDSPLFWTALAAFGGAAVMAVRWVFWTGANEHTLEMASTKNHN